MQWWNEFVTWLNSVEGRRVLTTAVIPFVAIVVAGLVAALIARGSSKRVLAYQDRELKAAAVMALIGAGRKATVWSSLGGDEKQRVDNQMSEADIRVRLLPVVGTNAAADWAAHELAAMKKNSANFSFQAEQTFVDYRNRLLEWQSKPKRARKLFAFDLEQWRYDDEAADKSLAAKQQEWAAQQAREKDAAATAVAPVVASPAALSAPAAVVPTSEVPDAPATGSSHDPASAPERIDTADAATVQHTAVLPSDSATPEVVGYVDEPSTDTAQNGVLSSESGDDYSPPVTAGTVRRRTDPDSSVDEPRY